MVMVDKLQTEATDRGSARIRAPQLQGSVSGTGRLGYNARQDRSIDGVFATRNTLRQRSVGDAMDSREADNRDAVESSVRLLSLARAGDQRALHRLCERYIPRLQRWASGRLPANARDLLDTSDVVQEAMIRAVGHLDRFEPRHDGALLAYLRQAVMNRIRDEIRRLRRRGVDAPPLTNPPEAASLESPLDICIGAEAVERYERALSRLSDTDRDLVIAKLEMGSDYAERARLLGKPSLDAARVAARRAVLKLAREMSHDDSR